MSELSSDVHATPRFLDIPREAVTSVTGRVLSFSSTDWGYPISHLGGLGPHLDAFGRPVARVPDVPRRFLPFSSIDSPGPIFHFGDSGPPKTVRGIGASASPRRPGEAGRRLANLRRQRQANVPRRPRGVTARPRVGNPGRGPATRSAKLPRGQRSSLPRETKIAYARSG